MNKDLKIEKINDKVEFDVKGQFFGHDCLQDCNNYCFDSNKLTANVAGWEQCVICNFKNSNATIIW